MTTARTFSILAVGLAIAGAIGTALVRYVAPAPVVGAFGFNEAAMVGYVVAGLSWASIGALLVIRRPENAVGWLMALVGVGYTLSQFSVAATFAFAAEGTVEGEHLAQIAGWVTVLLQLVAILQVAIGFIFPNGRVQSSGWARFMRLFWVFAGVFVVTSLFQPGPLQLIPGVQNPFGFGPDLRGGHLIAPVLTVVTLIVLTSLGFSMVTRYRAAGRVERLQLKWFILALALSAIGLGIAQSDSSVVDRPDNAMGLTVHVVAGALIPIAIGIAILRHGLYDIDRLISRTLSYAAITAVLAGVFAVAGVSLGILLGSLAEGQTIAVAASTLLVAALFGPLRRRAQTLVDRRFDRARFDAERTAAAFSERLRDEVDIDTVTTDLRDTVQAAIKPAQMGVWLRVTVR